MPHQVDRAAPIRCRRPGEPQFRGPLTKLVRRFRQVLDVYAEERVECFDLDVEPFHQRNRHGPQIRKTAANRDLRDRMALRADGRQKFRELIDEPGGEIVAPREYCRVVRHGRHTGGIFIPPRELARAEQRAVANERDARHGSVQGDVGLNPAGDGEGLSRSRQPEERVGRRDHRSNADAGLDERPDRRRHIVRMGQREHHRLPVRAFDCRRRRRDIGDRAPRIDSRRPGRRQGFSPHLFVGVVRHDHLSVIASYAPHDNRHRPATDRREPSIGLGARRRQD